MLPVFRNRTDATWSPSSDSCYTGHRNSILYTSVNVKLSCSTFWRLENDLNLWSTYKKRKMRWALYLVYFKIYVQCNNCRTKLPVKYAERKENAQTISPLFIRGFFYCVYQEGILGRLGNSYKTTKVNFHPMVVTPQWWTYTRSTY